MKILIEIKNLIDFPYDAKHDFMFQMDDNKINNLVSEILYASPTCYLVSGYRGAGKTSFIKKVQAKCKKEIEKQNSDGKGIKKVLFVYSSFSKYENQTNFLRKIIRDLEETIRKNKIKHEADTTKNVDDLNKKTFKLVEEEYSENTETENVAEYSLDVDSYIKKMLVYFAPILIPFVSEIIFSFPYFSENPMPWARGITYAISLLWLLFDAVKFTKKYSIKRSVSNKKSEKSITDDDIINYSLEMLIDRFNEQGYKLVFVLDELDKVDDNDFDNLLKEMKPWLVRGKADFIVVAGQKLSMKYYQVRDRDDEILASLFSKIIHINLLQEYNFEKLFNDFLCKAVIADEKASSKPVAFNELSETDKEKVIDLRSGYVYRCKRLPRTFFNLIRQDLQWNNDEAYISVIKEGYESEKMKLKALKKVFDKISIDAALSETIKDHFIMQLFFIASTLELKLVSPKVSFEEFIAPLKLYRQEEGQKIIYEYQNLKPKLEYYLEDFYYSAQTEALIEFDDITREKRNEGQTINFDMEYVHEEKEHETNSLSEKEQIELDNFKSEFLEFFTELKQFQKLLFPDETVDNFDSITFSDLLSYFQYVLYFDNIHSPALEMDYFFYVTHKSDNKLFEEIKQVLNVNNFRFGSAYSALLDQHVNNCLGEVFLEETLVEGKKGLSTSERQYANYKILKKDINDNNVALFCRFQYIVGKAKISGEEITRAIEFLQDMNMESQRGNYLIHIIFQSDIGNDYQLNELNAAIETRKVREDLSNRIFYIVLPRISFSNLKNELNKIIPKIILYNVKPKLNESEAKLRSRKNKRISIESNLGFFDPEDPNKGKFGGESSSNERILCATVVESTSLAGLYNLDLAIQSTNAEKPVIGKAIFYLHPTFNPDQISVLAQNGKAELKGLLSYEAFTVGAACDNNSTRLELDLNTLENAPNGFKY